MHCLQTSVGGHCAGLASVATLCLQLMYVITSEATLDAEGFCLVAYVTAMLQWARGLLLLHEVVVVAFADPLPPHLVYYQVKSRSGKVRWIANRATSKLEGLHKHFNKLLTCGNIGSVLAGVLICHWSGRWNIDRGIQNRGATDYGMYGHRWVNLYSFSACLVGDGLIARQQRLCIAHCLMSQVQHSNVLS